MTIGFLFWLLYILGLVFGFGGLYIGATDGRSRVWGWGGSILLWVLLFLLGWRAFGFPISG